MVFFKLCYVGVILCLMTVDVQSQSHLGLSASQSQLSFHPMLNVPPIKAASGVEVQSQRTWRFPSSQSQPSFHPSQSQPSFYPSQSQPSFHPSQSQPSFHPSESKPSFHLVSVSQSEIPPITAPVEAKDAFHTFSFYNREDRTYIESTMAPLSATSSTQQELDHVIDHIKNIFNIKTQAMDETQHDGSNEGPKFVKTTANATATPVVAFTYVRAGATTAQGCISFLDQVVNINARFSAQNGVFCPQISGLYLVSYSACARPGNPLRLSLWRGNHRLVTSQSRGQVSRTLIITLLQDELLYLKVEGGELQESLNTENPAYTSFSGVLLEPSEDHVSFSQQEEIDQAKTTPLPLPQNSSPIVPNLPMAPPTRYPERSPSPWPPFISYKPPNFHRVPYPPSSPTTSTPVSGFYSPALPVLPHVPAETKRYHPSLKTNNMTVSPALLIPVVSYVYGHFQPYDVHFRDLVMVPEKSNSFGQSRQVVCRHPCTPIGQNSPSSVFTPVGYKLEIKFPQDRLNGSLSLLDSFQVSEEQVNHHQGVGATTISDQKTARTLDTMQAQSDTPFRTIYGAPVIEGTGITRIAPA